MTELIRSAVPSDTMTFSEMAEILGLKEGEQPTDDVIGVCDGEWRRNADRTYTFWFNPVRFE